MRYQKIPDIWSLGEAERARLQPGQWVRAGSGSDAAQGRYMGQRRGSGVDVVAWQGNRPRGQQGRAYDAALRQYAKG